MLTDLVQYFTKPEATEVEETEISYFLRFVYEHTHDNEIRNAIENSFNRENLTNYYEMYDDGFFEEYYLNDWHLADTLNISCDNALLTLLFSTVMPANAIQIHFDGGIPFEAFFDDATAHDKVKLDEFKPYKQNRKIDACVNNCLMSILTDIASVEGDVGCIDSYELETTDANIAWIEFKNKSVARKIRKAYVVDGEVRSAFEQLGFVMINGVFICIQCFNIEEVSYNGYFDIDEVYDGFYALFRYVGENKNEVGRYFEQSIKRLNRTLEGYSQRGEFYSFFTEILKKHSVIDREVIL